MESTASFANKALMKEQREQRRAVQMDKLGRTMEALTEQIVAMRHSPTRQAIEDENTALQHAIQEVVADLASALRAIHREKRDIATVHSVVVVDAIKKLEMTLIHVENMCQGPENEGKHINNCHHRKPRTQ